MHEKYQNTLVSFRANEMLINALSERARQSGCSLSEYLRAVVREKVGME